MPIVTTLPLSTSMASPGAVGSSSSKNIGVIVGVVGGVTVAILIVLTVMLVCVVAVYKRKKSTSSTYAIQYCKCA